MKSYIILSGRLGHWVCFGDGSLKRLSKSLKATSAMASLRPVYGNASLGFDRWGEVPLILLMSQGMVLSDVTLKAGESSQSSSGEV